METMTRRSALGTLGAAFLVGCARERGVVRASPVRDALKGHVESGEVPSLVALTAEKGDVKVVALGAERDAIFRVASMTKPVIAAATMVLLESQKLRLDEPVDRLLPELANRNVLKRPD